jgi:hypothetical protein
MKVKERLQATYLKVEIMILLRDGPEEITLAILYTLMEKNIPHT